MRRALRVSVLAALLVGGAIALAAGCKQGEGDRCQVNQDCESGLVCSTATGTCQGDNNQMIDAAPVPDSPVVDAMPDATAPDARLDAAPDATPDATPDAS